MLRQKNEENDEKSIFEAEQFRGFDTTRLKQKEFSWNEWKVFYCKSVHHKEMRKLFDS